MFVSLAGWIALPLAFGVTPWLLGGLLAPGGWRADRVAAAAVCGVGLNTLLPALLHVLPVPLSGATLAVAHLLLAGLAAGVSRWRWSGTADAAAEPVTARLSPAGPGWWLLPASALALVLLLFPYTHFTGIDTYKWQDLAVAVYATEAVPWLVHPLSLLGFTPRAYPAAQPLALASIYLLTGLHVRFAFYWLSLWTAATALVTSLALGRRIFARTQTATLFAACYILTPVFIRYSHWATGRGLFLAIVPAYLLVLQALPRRRAWLWFVPVAGVLLLTHKVAWVAVALGLVSCAVGWVAGLFMPPTGLVPVEANVEGGGRAHPHSTSFTTGTRPVGSGRAALLATIALAALIVPSWGGGGMIGAAGGLVRYGIARGNWLAPAALLALLTGQTGLTASARTRFALLGLCSVPLLFEAQMYGALVALPAMAATAAGGAQTLMARVPRGGGRMRVLLFGMLLAGAVVIVGQRNRMAAPPRLVRAARFLQAHDPAGPFMIIAPGRARPLMQAYQTGSPRFTVTTGDGTAVRWRRPPVWRDSVAGTLRAWSVWGRAMIHVDGSGSDWYGPDPRRYYVRIGGTGDVPSGADRLYAHDGIEIYKGP